MNSTVSKDMTHPDEALLMAYADGQLSPEQREYVDGLLLAEPALRDQVELFRQSAALAQLHWPSTAPAVPDALQASVLTMVAKAQASAPQQAPARPQVPLATPSPQPLVQRPAANSRWYAMVATVACVAVGTLAFLAGTKQAGSPVLASNSSAVLVLTADTVQAAEWQAHLSQSPSGVLLPLMGGAQATPEQMKILATVRDAQGRLCREFSIAQAQRNTIGVACHQSDPNSWQLQFAAHLPVQASGYTPASSAQVLDAFISSIGGGAVLATEEERKELAGLPKRTYP